MAATLTFGTPVEPDRFSKYFGYAVGAHVVLLGALAFMPSDWLGQDAEPEKNVIYISLGGTVGEDTSGLRTVAARPVQEATPEPVRPQYQAPAEKPPVMAIPEKTPVKPAPKPPAKTPIQTTTERPASRTPIRGSEVRQGQARVDTRVETGADGLALQSGGGTGGETNLSNFCCPGYITAMSAAIKRNWKQNMGVAGQNTVRFAIERDGRITGLELIEPSGVYALDRESQVVLSNAKLPPLPAQFTEPKLVIRLIFEYK
ncbi:MAG TPA: TonB family protein [Vicinamibacterales bacterium]